MIRVVLADDHRMIRQKLKRLLAQQPEWQVAAEADNGPDAVRLVKHLKPHVFVTDLALPGLHGLEVTRLVHRQCPRTRIVVVSIHGDEAYVRQALRHGARAYVHKTDIARHLLPAIRSVLAGGRYLSTAVAGAPSRPPPGNVARAAAARRAAFSRRERSLLLLAAQGHTDREIASHLRLKLAGARRLRSRLMRRIGAQTDAEFSALARKIKLAEGKP